MAQDPDLKKISKAVRRFIHQNTENVAVTDIHEHRQKRLKAVLEAISSIARKDRVGIDILHTETPTEAMEIDSNNNEDSGSDSSSSSCCSSTSSNGISSSLSDLDGKPTRKHVGRRATTLNRISDVMPLWGLGVDRVVTLQDELQKRILGLRDPKGTHITRRTALSLFNFFRKTMGIAALNRVRRIVQVVRGQKASKSTAEGWRRRPVAVYCIPSPLASRSSTVAQVHRDFGSGVPPIMVEMAEVFVETNSDLIKVDICREYTQFIRALRLKHQVEILDRLEEKLRDEAIDGPFTNWIRDKLTQESSSLELAPRRGRTYRAIAIDVWIEFMMRSSLLTEEEGTTGAIRNHKKVRRSFNSQIALGRHFQALATSLTQGILAFLPQGAINTVKNLGVANLRLGASEYETVIPQLKQVFMLADENIVKPFLNNEVLPQIEIERGKREGDPLDFLVRKVDRDPPPADIAQEISDH